MALYLEDTDVLKKRIRTNWVKFDIHMKIPSRIIKNLGIIELKEGAVGSILNWRIISPFYHGAFVKEI